MKCACPGDQERKPIEVPRYNRNYKIKRKKKAKKVESNAKN